MTATKRKTKKRVELSEQADWAGPAVVGAVAMQIWLEMGAEALRFVRDRWQQDIKTQQALLRCTTLDDVRAVQTEFMVALQAQYANEASTMMGIFTKAAGARGYDDVPL